MPQQAGRPTARTIVLSPEISPVMTAGGLVSSSRLPDCRGPGCFRHMGKHPAWTTIPVWGTIRRAHGADAPTALRSVEGVVTETASWQSPDTARLHVDPESDPSAEWVRLPQRTGVGMVLAAAFSGALGIFTVRESWPDDAWGTFWGGVL